MVLKCLAWATLECDWAELEVTIPNACVSTYEYDRRTGELTLLKLFEVVIEGEVRFLTEILDDFRRFVDEIWRF